MNPVEIEWLEPWASTMGLNSGFHDRYRRQLELEVSQGHPLFGLPTKLIAKGNGDDALFSIEDGSERIAAVHLTWVQKQQRPPYPVTQVYLNIQQFIEVRMRPDHLEWED
jgi:hypothetical protein